MQQFIGHWTEVNAAIAPSVLTLKGGYTLAMFTADRDAIQSEITGIESVDNDRQITSASRDIKKAGARERLSQYRFTVMGLLAGTPYANTLPLLPRFRANQAMFLKAMDDMANGWSRINTDTIPGFTPPLLLSGGYALADHIAAVADLRAAYLSSTNAEDNSQLKRSVRNALLGPAKERMIQYRNAVRGILPTGHPLLMTIPAVTPPPGSTPAAVKLDAVWNPATSKADLSWSASANPKLDHYSLRTAPAPYKTADESVVAKLPANQTEYSTDSGLLAPGSVAQFKVYVVLTTGNEKGSNTVSITHPGP
jgi:hypothetical protein